MTLPQIIQAAVVVAEDSPNNLVDIFHRVNEILSEDQEIVSVAIDTSVAEAFKLMKKYKFSQVPVMAGVEVLGSFSYRSFSVKISSFAGEGIDLDKFVVGDFLETVEFVHVLDDFVSTLDTLDKKDVILVGSRDNLKGLLSPIDLVKYLYAISSPFVLIAEIELSIRSILRSSVSVEQLRTLIEQSLSEYYKPGKLPKSLEDMTFNNYIQVIFSETSWAYFEPAFGQGELQKRRAQLKLDEVRRLRNDVFHFKRKLTPDDIGQLIDHRDWIKQRLTAFQAKKAER
jgi:predicted transcriptional regulator